METYTINHSNTKKRREAKHHRALLTHIDIGDKKHETSKVYRCTKYYSSIY